jgi:riboflavin synthase
MFTGIINELGTIDGIGGTGGLVRLSVRGPVTADGLVVGDSVAVNGVCLTVVGVDDVTFHVDVVLETLDRSSLGALREGDRVNLERPMPAHGRYDGHIVQGHVDGVGRILSMEPEGESVRVTVELPDSLGRYVVEKGSIAVDGTSLTVAGVAPLDATSPTFSFVLIPHTMEVTVFRTKTVGDTVNLEVDVIAKYVERLLGGAR